MGHGKTNSYRWEQRTHHLTDLEIFWENELRRTAGLQAEAAYRGDLEEAEHLNTKILSIITTIERIRTARTNAKKKEETNDKRQTVLLPLLR